MKKQNLNFSFDFNYRERLDIFLSKKTEMPRVKINYLIKIGGVKVNNQVVLKNSFMLKKQDIINLFICDNYCQKCYENYIPNKNPSLIQKKDIHHFGHENSEVISEKNFEFKGIPSGLKYLNNFVLKETGEFVFIHKPWGVLSHGFFGLSDTITMEDFLLDHYFKTNELKEKPNTGAYIPHRLDRSVSGLMVFGKEKKSLEKLLNAFAERKVKKKYTALVYGELKSEITINKPIFYDKNKEIGLVHKDGKEAITKIVPETFFQGDNITKISVFPLTGRQHQIRVHLASIGFPIIGDSLYNKKNDSVNINEFHNFFLRYYKFCPWPFLTSREKTLLNIISNNITEDIPKTKKQKSFLIGLRASEYVLEDLLVQDNNYISHEELIDFILRKK